MVWSRCRRRMSSASGKRAGRSTRPKVAPERHLVLSFEDTHDAAHPDAPRIDQYEADNRLRRCAAGRCAAARALPARPLALDGASCSACSPVRSRPGARAISCIGLRPVATPNMLLVRALGRTARFNGELVSVGEKFPMSGLAAWRRTGKFPHKRNKGGG